MINYGLWTPFAQKSTVRLFTFPKHILASPTVLHLTFFHPSSEPQLGHRGRCSIIEILDIERCSQRFHPIVKETLTSGHSPSWTGLVICQVWRNRSMFYWPAALLCRNYMSWTIGRGTDSQIWDNSLSKVLQFDPFLNYSQKRCDLLAAFKWLTN